MIQTQACVLRQCRMLIPILMIQGLKSQLERLEIMNLKEKRMAAISGNQPRQALMPVGLKPGYRDLRPKMYLGHRFDKNVQCKA